MLPVYTNKCIEKTLKVDRIYRYLCKFVKIEKCTEISQGEFTGP